MQSPSIPLETCMSCFEGAPVHFDWHPTRAQLLEIGAEMTRRVQERDRIVVRQMDDTELVGYGVRLRRMLSTAEADGWDDILIDITKEWLAEAEKEWRWRERAASLGADAVIRSGASWADRVDRVKAAVSVEMLVAYECDGIPKARGKWTCICPFHSDRHPSLDVDTVKGVWLCRACGVGGDAIRYAELRYSLTFPAAVRHLEVRLGITPPEREIHGVQIVRPDGAV